MSIHNFETKLIFGIPIAVLTLRQISHVCISLIEKGSKKTFFYVNAHCLNLANRDQEYKNILKQADLVYSGGLGPVLASKILGDPLLERTPTPDFIDKIFTAAQKLGWSIFLLGTTNDSLKTAVEKLQQKFPRLKIVGTHHGFSSIDNKNVISQIKKTRPDIILVGMGTPKQEKWIARYQDEIDAKTFWAVGALFDVISGRLPRAPLWMQKAGLEWFYRLLQEPGRLWRRYLVGNVLFLRSVLVTLWRRKLRALLKRVYFSLMAIFYSYPKNVRCSYCSWQGRAFLPFRGRAGEICPQCQSKARHRFLYQVLQKLFREKRIPSRPRILHVSPEVLSIGKFLKKKAGQGYTSIDVVPGLAMETMDLTSLEFNDDVFDLVFLSHVLEHIKDEGQALKEIKRVLKTKGIAVICVPINSKVVKTTEFNQGQVDNDLNHHVREYGSDFSSRLKRSGFVVDMVSSGYQWAAVCTKLSQKTSR